MSRWIAVCAVLLASACGGPATKGKAAGETSAAASAAAAGHESTGTVGGTACPARPLRDYADKMVGGDDASIKLWPGFVLIGAEAPDGAQAEYDCGGVLLDKRTVLTAAHCLLSMEKVEGADTWTSKHKKGWPIVVLANTDDISNDSEQVVARVTEAAWYEKDGQKFDRDKQGRYLNDIAYLKLNKDLEGEVATLSGADASDPAFAGQLLWAAGFGRTDASAQSSSYDSRRGAEKTRAPASKLKDAILQYAPEEICSPANGNGIDVAMHICAGWKEGKHDTCQGDSGGPLVMLDHAGCPVVVGLTSFGRGCGAADSFGVYTRVSSYRDWIKGKASQTRFVDAPPPIAGEEAFRRLVETIVEIAGDKPEGLRVHRMAGAKDVTREPVSVGTSFRYEIEADRPGRLLAIERQESGVYEVFYPKPADGGGEISPGHNVIIGGFNPSITNPGAKSEQGQAIFILLPREVVLENVFLTANRKKSAVEPAPPAKSAEQARQIRQVLRLLGLATGQDDAPPPGSISVAKLDYVIIGK